MGALDIGIDLGTTKIIIYKSDAGILLREPSVVAVHTRDNSIIAIGEEALGMLGRTPGYIRAEYPLQDGVISDPEMAEAMLQEFIRRACHSFLVKHRVVICVPSTTTDVERRAVTEAVIHAGGRHCYLIEEPIAAAIGVGIDITQPSGHMIVDIGGGTADAAVISLTGVVASCSMRYAGNRIDDDIVKQLALRYKLSIGRKTAERLKKEIGTVWQPSSEHTSEARGRNLLSGYPQVVPLSEWDLYDTIRPFGDAVVNAIKRVFDQTPPELTGDIIHNGIVLTGGGALLNGLPELIAHETGLAVRVADHPIDCVAVGTGKAFDYIGEFQSGFLDVPNPRS